MVVLVEHFTTAISTRWTEDLTVLVLEFNFQQHLEIQIHLRLRLVIILDPVVMVVEQGDVTGQFSPNNKGGNGGSGILLIHA